MNASCLKSPQPTVYAIIFPSGEIWVPPADLIVSRSSRVGTRVCAWIAVVIVIDKSIRAGRKGNRFFIWGVLSVVQLISDFLCDPPQNPLPSPLRLM